MCVRERLTFRNLSSSCCAHRNACCDSRKLDSDEQKASCGVLMNWSPVRRWMHIDRVFFERRRCDSGCVQGGGGRPQESGASFGAYPVYQPRLVSCWWCSPQTASRLDVRCVLWKQLDQKINPAPECLLVLHQVVSLWQGGEEVYVGSVLASKRVLGEAGALTWRACDSQLLLSICSWDKK